MATKRAPCVAQVRKSQGSDAVEIFDGMGEGYSRMTGLRDLAQAKHIAARRYREAVGRTDAWRMTQPPDAVFEPDFLYIP